MDKDTLIRELDAKLRSGEIDSQELINHLRAQSESDYRSVSEPDSHRFSHFSITKILYVIGAVIVIMGIMSLAGQVWDVIGAVGRILLTFGLGIVFAVLGSALFKLKPDEKIGAVFHLIGGVLIPIGVAVIFNEFDINSIWLSVFASLILSVFYAGLAYVHRHPILTLYTIFYSTSTLYLFTSALLDVSYIGIEGTIFGYLTMVVGFGYLLLSRAFKYTWNEHLTGALNFLGGLGIFGSGFFLMFEYRIWEFLLFVLICGGLYLAVSLKSRSILMLSTVSLVIHMTYITSEYFADSIGWPISLVILGFLFIGLGYASITINKRYIK